MAGLREKIELVKVAIDDCHNFSSDGDDDDFFEDEENTFSRLEEKREQLEQELGCEVFLKAYKTVQVSASF